MTILLQDHTFTSAVKKQDVGAAALAAAKLVKVLCAHMDDCCVLCVCPHAMDDCCVLCVPSWVTVVQY